MDAKNKQKLSVHRCRFIDFTPSAISALAFPPLPLPRLKKGRVVESEPTKRSSSSKRKFGTLAVGRANGNIELYEWSGLEHHVKSSQSWTLWKILYGPNPSKVDSLAFSIRNPYLLSTNEVPSIKDLRLFSAGGGSEMVEWDLQRGTVLRTIPSQGGAIWSMAVNPSSSVLALGCEDGCVRLLSVENDELSHLRKFDRAKCRVMSIAFGPPIPPRAKVKSKPRAAEGEEGDFESDDSDDDDDEWSDEWLVTGGSDSSIRKWDVKTGRVVDRMITDKLRKQATLVWTVTVLADGTIISGDSMGDVTFWDAMTCTQLSSFRAHGADVLCLAVSPDGETIFSSGVDQKASLFSLVRLSSNSSTQTRWVHSLSKRMHAHDVRALAMWPPYAPLLLPNSKPPPRLNPQIAPVLASGGLDMCVTLSPCACPSAVSQTTRNQDSQQAGKVINPLASSSVPTFEDGVYRRVGYPTGLAPAICMARRAGLVVSTGDEGVSIWKIRKDRKTAGVEDIGVKEINIQEGGGYEKLLDMELDTTTNICASAVSEDGRWIAVSDVYETKLFELRDILSSPRPKRVKSLPSLLTRHLPRGPQYPAYHGCGASALAFSPDGSKLIVAAAVCGSVLVVDLGGGKPDGEREVRVLRRFDHHRSRDAIFGGRVTKAMPKSRGGNDGREVNGKSDNAEDQESSEANENDSDSENDDAFETRSRSPSPAPFDPSSAPDAPTPLITRLSVSADGQWLASTDTHRRTHIFNLDSVSHHASLPSTPQTVNAMAFWAMGASNRDGANAENVGMTSHASTPLLVLALANNTLSIYDVEARRFPEWARRVCEAVPQTFKRIHDSVQGIIVDPGMEDERSKNNVGEGDEEELRMDVDGEGEGEGNKGSDGDETAQRTKPPQSTPSRLSSSSKRSPNRILFWGSSWLCSANLNPSSTSNSPSITTFDESGIRLPSMPSNKRRLEIAKIQERRTLQAMKNRDAANNFGAAFNLYAVDNDNARQTNKDKDADSSKARATFNFVTRYRPILFADFLGPNELVVVERPLVDLMATLPPAFFKPKYGR